MRNWGGLGRVTPGLPYLFTILFSLSFTNTPQNTL